ncbi:putative Fe-S, FMN containing oxidoreductase [Actinosynnema pretiosum subsp. pretiosum]|nr:putative Fe-S, FMN containing oxidoreductase [Actinosynnema pretiosum subsp. pretiosum]
MRPASSRAGAGAAEHLEAHGPLRFPPGREAFVAGLAAAGPVGRGSGGFPAHLKAASVVGARVVVANGCEGEPLSGEDRALLERAPHLVPDGLVVTAAATRLVTVAGDVREPGVREAPLGTTAEQFVELAGGGTEELAALLVGGCGGRWVRPVG